MIGKPSAQAPSMVWSPILEGPRRSPPGGPSTTHCGGSPTAGPDALGPALHLHMHASHVHAGICMRGMHAPTYACMACIHTCMLHPKRTSTPHLTGGGHHHVWGPSAVDPMGTSKLHLTSHRGEHHHHHTITIPGARGGGRGDHWTLGHIYIYIYIYVVNILL